MLTVIYSINKVGYELEFWERELRAASNDQVRFVTFNHGSYLSPSQYQRAQLLDNCWFDKNEHLLAMYNALEAVLRSEKASVLVVDNTNPYHPEFLRALDVYKVLRMSDGPTIAYDRDFPIIHAFDHVLYHTRAYSPELTMPEKLAYLGVQRADHWPLALFDAAWDSSITEHNLLTAERDIDIAFVGALHLDKMPLLAAVKRAFGARCHLYGLSSLKRNIYFNAKFRAMTWVRPLEFQKYIPLYQRTKVGFNVHLRGDYTVGGYRLFELPANGVLQISDGGEYLEDFYRVGKEVESYRSLDDLIVKMEYFLSNEEARKEVTLAAFRRTMRDHRIDIRMAELGNLLQCAI